MPAVPEKLLNENAQQQSWHLFVKAKYALVGKHEQPIHIKPVTSDSLTESELRAEVLPPTEREDFYKQLQNDFRLKPTDIDPERGVFWLDWETSVPEGQLRRFKGVANEYNFDYEPDPFLEGHITLISGNTVPPVDSYVNQQLIEADLDGRLVPVQSGLNKAGTKYWVLVRNVDLFEKEVLQFLSENDFAFEGVQAILRASKLGQPPELHTIQVNDLTGVSIHGATKLRAQGYTRVEFYDLHYKFSLPVDFYPLIQLALAPFDGLIKQLRSALPQLEVQLLNNGEKICFRYFMPFAEKEHNYVRFSNYMQELRGASWFIQQFTLELTDSTRLEFKAADNQSARLQYETDRLSKLIGAEIEIGQGPGRVRVGVLEKVKYPAIRIGLFPDQPGIPAAVPKVLLEALSKGVLQPNLTGDREKLARLTDALRIIANHKAPLPNPRTRLFLYNAAEARGAKFPDELLRGSKTWDDVAAHSFLPLNDSQVEAIVSTLLVPDLALVQGPPGTGKSTAISQIIWHHVRRNPHERMLLTSETNMAVDNALEKLENRHHNLVKPIRIGSEKNLENEGSRYSLPKIKAWSDTPESDMLPGLRDNIVCKWVGNIVRRSAACSTLPPDLQAEWAATLNAPIEDLKKLFRQQYLDHVNVIGATGSSIGEKNTKGIPTTFFRQYQTVFANRPKPKTGAEEKPVRKGRHNEEVPEPSICFDVVVMDEASKATPPELALSLIYARKAIIIGDHRQLPPMLDEADFKTTLEEEGQIELAQQFSRADAETSQFERLFKAPGVAPGVVSRFNTQYRMHPHINDAIQQFYQEDGGLLCGIPVADADDPDLNNPLSRYHGLQHEKLLQPNQHLIWVEVDEPEMSAGLSSRLNLAEVQAVRAVLKCLTLSKGFAEFQGHWNKPEDQEVGLITFYSQQAKLLQEVADEFKKKLPARARAVDRFQGMERNIVVVSLVRSNKIMESRFQQPDLTAYPSTGGYPRQTSLGFAQFPNRLNVALSRAKRLLVIVGNSRHFSRNDCYRRVYETVVRCGHVIDYKELLPYLDQSV